MCMLKPMVLVVKSHSPWCYIGAGGCRDKIDILRKRLLLGVKEPFIGSLDSWWRCFLSTRISSNSYCLVLLLTFANGDVVSNKVDLKLWGLLLKNALNDGVYCVMMMEGGRHLTDKTHRSNIIGGCEALGA